MFGATLRQAGPTLIDPRWFFDEKVIPFQILHEYISPLAASGNVIVVEAVFCTEAFD
jgi:hypothetical protein